MPPEVSIIVPCYNEVHTIGGLLEAIQRQTYPHSSMEVIIADGGSVDGTRELIKAFASWHPNLRIKLVNNPRRVIPAALNTALKSAAGEIVIRLDAHSEPAEDYIERSLETLKRTQAANVGGQWEIRPGRDTWIGRSIAAAAAHPLGAGGARYRTGGAQGEVDTVPFGAYRKEWVERVGPFDESLMTNEDYEYNVRIRRQGGVIWFNPDIRSAYYARGTLRDLARQYARYGFWKARMLLRHPSTLRPRQALPPIFVLSTLLLAGLASYTPLVRGLLAIEWGAYVLTLVAAGIAEAIRSRDLLLALGVPLALATMHLAWGSAFWWGLLTGLLNRTARGG
jgi:succinoglycan biosynthesis protein ExoA